MTKQYKDGEVVEWRALDAEGKPVGDPLVVRYTNEGKVVVRPRAEDGGLSSSREENSSMEVIAPMNPLAEILGRLLPLAERWLQKQVGEEGGPRVESGDTSPLVKEWYTPEEASVLLRLHVQTIMKWCREGELGAVKIGGNKLNGKGGKYLIPRKAIDDYLREQRVIHGERRRNAK